MRAWLGPGTYAAGVAALLTAVVVLGWGAWRLRRALLPDWSGAPARLGEVVLALAAALGAAELLGSFGALRRGWTLLAELGAGLALAGAAKLAGHAPRAERSRPIEANATSSGDLPEPALAPRLPPRPRREVVAAVIGLAVVVAQWGAHTADAMARGMTHPDTLWYHGPFAARFLQRGSFSGLGDLGYESARSYPFNSEVLHALVALPFERDFLSPLLNLGWLALAALAAWCLGRRRGVAALCLLGTVVALGLPILSGTQPGQASNDASAAILLLAAAALLVEGGLAPAPTALAGIAAGLALGTKLIVAAPVVALTVGIAVVARRESPPGESTRRVTTAALVTARRPAVVGLWCAGLAACSGYWFVRNWVALDNPLPWFGFDLGPFSLTKRIDEGGTALVDHLTDRDYWSLLYLPSFRQALGRGWPVMPLVPLGGALAAASRRRSLPLERVFGITVLAGFVAYVFTPLGGGLAVWSNVRYLSPVLLLGFAFAPLALAGAGATVRRAAAVVLLGLVVLNATTPYKAAMSPWPQARVLPGVLLGLAVVALAGSRGLLARHGLLGGRTRPAAAALLVVAVASAGWWAQRSYLEQRYVDAGLPLDPLNAYFHDVRDSRVAVIGTVETYPMFGPDLSNRVVQLGRPVEPATDEEVCRRWEPLLDGRVDYVVVTSYGVVYTSVPPADWFEHPVATEVLREGVTTVYRLDGPLRPPGCT